jgi:hypothetical protein
MVVSALVPAIVIEIACLREAKRSILLATLQAEHFRLLRPASSGRRDHGRPTRPRLAPAASCASAALEQSRLAGAAQRKKAGLW